MRRGRLWAFLPAMEKADREIKGFLYPRMYRHDRVMRVMADAEARGAGFVRALHENARRSSAGVG